MFAMFVCRDNARRYVCNDFAMMATALHNKNKHEPAYTRRNRNYHNRGSNGRRRSRSRSDVLAIPGAQH